MTFVDWGFGLATLGALGYAWVLLQRGLRAKAERGGGEASVRIEDGWLIAALPGAMASRCELRRVTTIAVSVFAGSSGVRRRVNFRGEGRCNCSVPLEAAGMAAVMAQVERWPGFSREAWRKAQMVTVAGRYGVWKGRLVVNAVIEMEAPRADFAEGLVTGKGVISWDVTYDALRATPGVVVVPNEFDRNEYRVEGPVWLGPLRLEWMRVYEPVSVGGVDAARTDVPVPAWNASVVVTEAWGENYVLLKQAFDEQFGAFDVRGSYEREDQANRLWHVGEMSVTINYTYNARNSNEMGYCSVAVRNGRRYAGYLEDDYTRTMRLEHVVWRQFLPGKVPVATNYRRSYWVRQTPEVMRPAAAAGWIVWNDTARGRLGFASGENAVVIERGQAARLTLQNAAPAKAGGYAELKVIDTAGRGTLVGSAGYRGFDEVVDAVGALTGLEVNRLQEYLDD